MPDNKTKTGKSDRQRVAAAQGYEVKYFASKHSMTLGQAREIIGRIGNDRAKLNEAASKIKRA